MNDSDPHGLNILVNEPERSRNLKPRPEPKDSLTKWVMDRVSVWEQHRDNNYKAKWDEFKRIYETEWSAADRERLVERSRIVPTSLAEAVDTKANDLIDGIFYRQRWVDVADDVVDDRREDIQDMGGKLQEDLDRVGAKMALQEAAINGGIYGTPIIKIALTEVKEAVPTALVNELGQTILGGAAFRARIEAYPVSIAPFEFAIDPAARTIDEALGCAHILTVPVHSIHAKQRTGVYRRGDIGTYTEASNTYLIEEQQINRDRARLVEYHGLVPAALMPASRAKPETRRAIMNGELSQDVEMVEAIVTIANDDFLLKAVENPFIRGDRSIIAGQWHKIPARFWGMGDIERGYHPHKALQTEIRARADGLALANYPTIWRDSSSLDGDEVREGPDAKIIEPGKEYLVNGDPNKMIREFKFSGPDPNSSVAIADYMRMVKSSTGADMGLIEWQTRSGSKMPKLVSNKRIFLNFEEQILKPLIDKTAWRYMQYRPDRYPPLDFKFRVMGGISIQQREVEQGMLVDLLGAIPPDSPAFYSIIRQIVENGTYSDRPELLAIIDTLISQALNPPPPPRDLGGEARLISAEFRKQEHADELMKWAEELKREDLKILLDARKVALESLNRTRPE